MEFEIEAKFLDINPEEIRGRLTKLGAKMVYLERMMRRKVFEHPTNKENDWFRVRDEGDKITLSYKKLFDRSLHGTKEVVVEVGDFEKACDVLQGAQLKFVSCQETKREKWLLDGSEITIDTWPWIPTFIEIESPAEENVKDIALKLGLDWNKAMHGSVETAYQKYYNVTEEEVDGWDKIIFCDVPEWLEKKRK